ncbi:aminotransferase class V-fold PLP-dependent enzyme [Rickettsiales endosymbiont of Trichoplax sp. H2]|uniref:aminotransferase class V-fold PLP-dependent enzyme n=1 Tax=Rickettsiales endosymbiont of Trichoplax sp. H2 TaxID=2021221 RepID=UPI0012B1A064|nr:SufS family cysteine desulfurase [Rickettsiales endosymbiont of Trichoplax sp. H2]MSO13736.1 Cysteine desulfurase [Rickettsiales endosymbiont of Trichoplax sp. H2]
MNIIRKDFPFFNQKDCITFLDSAASSQKPKCVIDKLLEFYSYNYANIHRGIYNLSSKATENFEKVRTNVAKFINSSSDKKIVFTKSATEGINLVAHSFGKKFINKGDEILISTMEHHSNIVPWQQLCKEKKAKLTVIPIKKTGDLDFIELEKIISTKVKIIAVTQMSNVFGSVVDIKKVVKIAKKYGAKVLIDACQSIAHMKIDVTDLDCDFLVFSSHKLYGPTGVGILYGKYDLLDYMDVYQTGGSMIEDVSFEKTTFLKSPHKFEAGTPQIAEVIAFGEAIDYLNSINLEKYWKEEEEIAKYIKTEIKKLDNFNIFEANQDTSIISITHKKAHHSDIGEILNKCNVAIRTGHHCAKPLMDYLKIPGTARISLGIYNNYEDAETLITALNKFNKLFS